MRHALAAVVLAGAFVLGAACGGKSAPNVAPEPKGKQAADKELVEGRQLYVANCQRCHGPAGQGLTAPKLAGVVTRTFPNIENQINLVTTGTGAMPAWKDTLTPAEIRAVVRYTREVL